MEKLMYESRPYAFIILGVVAFMANSSYPKLTNFSALILMACSGAILYWRHTQRTATTQPTRYRKY